jgi:hypothetical protein
VLAIHDRQLIEHGGAEGLRDESLLQSALGRPLNHFEYESTDIVELAAKYTAGIVQNTRSSTATNEPVSSSEYFFLSSMAIGSRPARRRRRRRSLNLPPARWRRVSASFCAPTRSGREPAESSKGRDTCGR